MNTWNIKAALMILSVTTAVACSSGEQVVNKRQDKKAQLTEFNKVLADKNKASGDAAPGSVTPDAPAGEEVVVVEIPVNDLKVAAPKLAADPALASLKAADLLLVNKLNATDFVLFGKDGKSWSYKPAAAAAEQLKEIKPIVVNPAGSTLYSLPDNQFWFVAPDKLGRHKAKAENAGDPAKSVTVEQFSTTTFLGDKSKIKVLFATVDEVIVQLDTHIAIVTIMPAPQPAQIKQLPLEKLPVDLKGDLTAGRSEGGYWFRSAAGIFFLSKTEKADVSPWSKSAFAIEGEGLSSLAIWPDEVNQKVLGVSLGLSAAGLVSDAVQPAPAAMP